MNKKSIILIITAGLILAIILILAGKHTPFGKNNTSFASPAGKEITRIELTDVKGKVVLERKGENWVLNGSDETRKTAVLFILRILSEIQIKSPVSEELFDTAIVKKNIEPVKVRTYENGRLIKSFLVYKTSSNPWGNIMKMKDRAKPFIVHLPGFDGDIGSGFTTNPLFWKPYTIFNLLPSEISSVKVEHLNDTSASFTITNKKGIYSLSGGETQVTGFDSSRVARYLSYFTFVPFESWAFNLDEKELSVVKHEKPVFRITVNKVNGEKQIITLWERMKAEGEKDSDRLYGKTPESEEIFIVRYFDLDPLLKKRKYFLGD